MLHEVDVGDGAGDAGARIYVGRAMHDTLNGHQRRCRRAVAQGERVLRFPVGQMLNGPHFLQWKGRPVRRLPSDVRISAGLGGRRTRISDDQ